MQPILIRFSDQTGAQLDRKRREGYSITGFVRYAVDKALKSDRRSHSQGRIGLHYRDARKRRGAT